MRPLLEHPKWMQFRLPPPRLVSRRSGCVEHVAKTLHAFSALNAAAVHHNNTDNVWARQLYDGANTNSLSAVSTTIPKCCWMHHLGDVSGAEELTAALDDAQQRSQAPELVPWLSVNYNTGVASCHCHYAFNDGMWSCMDGSEAKAQAFDRAMAKLPGMVAGGERAGWWVPPGSLPSHCDARPARFIHWLEPTTFEPLSTRQNPFTSCAKCVPRLHYLGASKTPISRRFTFSPARWKSPMEPHSHCWFRVDELEALGLAPRQDEKPTMLPLGSVISTVDAGHPAVRTNRAVVDAIDALLRSLQHSNSEPQPTAMEGRDVALTLDDLGEWTTNPATTRSSEATEEPNQGGGGGGGGGAPLREQLPPSMYLSLALLSQHLPCGLPLHDLIPLDAVTVVDLSKWQRCYSAEQLVVE